MNEKRKQIILIMTDTTRKDMLGCYGNKDMKTPHLDRLAPEGIRYENAYTVQPVCGPARSALFTGVNPHSNGVVANSLPLGKNVKTIGERLSDQGVHCGYIGKWHLDGGDYFGLGACPEGWDVDYWYDMKNYLDELTDQEKEASRKPETAFKDWPESLTYAGRCTNRAMDFICKFREEDFFLTVSYDEPHGPSICPAPFQSMYQDYTMPPSPNYTDELYDRNNDPFELHNLIDDPEYEKIRNSLHDQILENMNRTRDIYRGYQWKSRPWRFKESDFWEGDGYTRQRENEEYEPRQLDYDTGREMIQAVRKKTRQKIDAAIEKKR